MLKKFIEIIFDTQVFKKIEGDGYWVKKRNPVHVSIFPVKKMKDGRFVLIPDTCGVLPYWDPHRKYEVVGELSQK